MWYLGMIRDGKLLHGFPSALQSATSQFIEKPSYIGGTFMDKAIILEF